MGSLQNFISNVLQCSLEEIASKICLWLAIDLKKVEKLTGKDFYSAKEKQRKRRPFLSGWCYGDTFVALFLSSNSRGYQKSVDLTLCEKRGCRDFPFYGKVYLFRNRKGKYEAIFLNRFQMEEIGTLCGCCENLERLRNFCSQREEQNE